MKELYERIKQEKQMKNKERGKKIPIIQSTEFVSMAMSNGIASRHAAFYRHLYVFFIFYLIPVESLLYLNMNIPQNYQDFFCIGGLEYIYIFFFLEIVPEIYRLCVIVVAPLIYDDGHFSLSFSISLFMVVTCFK
ncbi:hypothetical protein ACOSQ2_029666 [Xanthoceras sorbifolium]